MTLVEIAAEMVAQSCKEQGLPIHIEDPATLDRLAAIIGAGEGDSDAA